MDQVALGKRIKAARERVGMTQEDLAAAVLPLWIIVWTM